LEGQRDILNKAFHEHALEVLIARLEENDFLVSKQECVEGDLCLNESTYRFYDFELLSKATNVELMQKLLFDDIEDIDMSLKKAQGLMNKPNPNAKERELLRDAEKVVGTHEKHAPTIKMINQLNLLATYGSSLLAGLTLIKADNTVGLLKNEFLRESVESLTFRTNRNRKVKFLVRVTGKKEKVFNGFNMVLSKGDDLDFLPGMMLDVILGSFDIIKNGDIQVTPIAIFYE
jgi:hypothetical protein